MTNVLTCPRQQNEVLLHMIFVLCFVLPRVLLECELKDHQFQNEATSNWLDMCRAELSGQCQCGGFEGGVQF